jgi:AhpC/TSA family
MNPIACRLTLAIALAVVVPACSRAESAESAVGAAAPDFTLPDLQGKAHHLAEYRGRVVVLEWINPNCPFSRRHAEEGTMTRTAAAHSDVVWLAINSTGKKHGDFLTPDRHASYDKEHGIA